MSVAELKTNLHQLIDDISDSKMLQAIYTLLSNKGEEKTDWWDELSVKEKASIERGLKNVKEGRVHSHSEVMKKSNALIQKYKK